jgi:hypothetical protein
MIDPQCRPGVQRDFLRGNKITRGIAQEVWGTVLSLSLLKIRESKLPSKGLLMMYFYFKNLFHLADIVVIITR